jgi:hypothetical protein
MRLKSTHAEVLGGVMVEPGGEFDPANVDPAVLDRLKKEGKVRDAPKPKPSASKGGDK